MADPTAPNPWCLTLGITPPRLEDLTGHPEANTFALLVVALLERGAPMTLPEVAARFEEAGIDEAWRALLSLQRCRPGRPPLHRDREVYHVDPHDPELERLALRLGLPRSEAAGRRPEVPARAEPPPLPGPDEALTAAELDDAWKGASLYPWSAQRVALAVLDAHGGPLLPAEVVAAVMARTELHVLRENAAGFGRRGSAIEVLADGRWSIAPDAGELLRGARAAVRDRAALARRHAAMAPNLAAIERRVAEQLERRLAGARALASRSQVLVVAFPPARPQAAALLDIGERSITTYVGDELAALPARLAGYDIIGGVDVRGLLRTLGVEVGGRRLFELGPAQKSRRLNRRGRSLKITTALLVQGSCGIGAPFGDEAKLAEYLAAGERTKLRRRLEADVKSLYALYEYGRLHGVVRLRWGFLDERLPAPWVQDDEPRLGDLKRLAQAKGVPLEVVVGSAPGWAEPWARGRLAWVMGDASWWLGRLVDEEGVRIDELEVQRARLAGPKG